MSKARQTALDADRKYLANNAYRFDGHDYLAAHLRKRARDRMHTIVREQAYLKRNPISRYSTRSGRSPREFVGRWNRANVGMSGTHSRRLFVGHQQDGRYVRVRYHIKRKR